MYCAEINMFAKFILFCFVFKTFSVALCPSGANPSTYCHYAKCANAENCPRGQYLVQRNPCKCICCSYCRNITVINTSLQCGPNQEPSMCYAVDCKDIQSCPNDQKLIRADYSKCICCNYCINK